MAVFDQTERVTSSTGESLICWGHHQLGDLASQLDQVVREWCSAWGLASSSMGCHAHAATYSCPGELAKWRLSVQGTTASTTMQMELRQTLFETGPSQLTAVLGPSLADELVEEALRDWMLKLARACEVDEVRIADAEIEGPEVRWAGHAVVSMKWCGVDSELWLAGEVVQRMLRFRSLDATAEVQPVVLLDQALDDVALRLQCCLGGVELSLGELSSLSVGDVILLPHSLNEPTWVLANSEQLAKAWLGVHRGRLAIEIC